MVGRDVDDMTDDDGESLRHTCMEKQANDSLVSVNLYIHDMVHGDEEEGGTG